MFYNILNTCVVFYRGIYKRAEIIIMLKKFVLMAVACACVGSYTVAGAQGTLDVKPNQPKSVVVEHEAPMVGMPSPFHEFSTVDEAAKYMNITPELAMFF